MAVAALDTVFLSSFLSVSETTISSILASPTVELVQAVLTAVAVKAQQHEEVQSEKLRLEVELENAVRGSEHRAQGLKASVDRALLEVTELRTKLNQEGEAHVYL